MDRPTSRQPLPPGRPVVRGDVVARRRLLERLGPATDVGAVCVTGAAGSGKTTLLATWLQTLPPATRAAWLTLRPEHNDPVRLADDLRELLLQARVPMARADAAGSLDEVLAALLAPAPDSPVVLVLDDVHVIHAEQVVDAIGSLLVRLPLGTCLVVCGREDPGLPWAVLRQRRAAVEIRDADLRFDEEETRRLLSDAFGIDPSDRRVADAVTIAEGWAAGLVLAGLALQAQPDSTAEVALSPRHRQFVDSFIDEAILATCSPEVRDFLHATAVLPVLEPSMCDLLTGRRDSAALLRELVDRNMLTEELAGPSPVFRYHALLRRALRQRLGPGDDEGRVDRVVAALAEHGHLVDATDLAVRAGSPEDAERWVRKACSPALARGYAATVARWLSALPADQLRRQPDLLLVLARAAGLSGDLLTAKAAVREVRRLADNAGASPGVRIGLQMLDTGVALWEGSLTEAVSSLRELLEIVPERIDDPVLDLLGLTRSAVLSTLAAALLMQGRLAESLDVADQAIGLGDLSPLNRHAVLCLGVRPLAHAWAGREQQATAQVESAMPLVTAWRSEAHEAILFWVAAAWVGPADQAEQSLARARRLTSGTAIPLLKALPAVAELRVRRRLGQYDRLPQSVQRAEEAVAGVPEPGHLSQVLRDEVLRAERYPGSPPDLSDQELAILRELAKGRSRRQVADIQHYSVNTVKTYLRSAYRKLGVGNRDEALARARAWGLLD